MELTDVADMNGLPFPQADYRLSAGTLDEGCNKCYAISDAIPNPQLIRGMLRFAHLARRNGNRHSLPS
jgi:hypothetical protein